MSDQLVHITLYRNVALSRSYSVMADARTAQPLGNRVYQCAIVDPVTRAVRATPTVTGDAQGVLEISLSQADCAALPLTAGGAPLEMDVIYKEGGAGDPLLQLRALVNVEEGETQWQ